MLLDRDHAELQDLIIRGHAACRAVEIADAQGDRETATRALMLARACAAAAWTLTRDRSAKFGPVL